MLLTAIYLSSPSATLILSGFACSLAFLHFPSQDTCGPIS